MHNRKGNKLSEHEISQWSEQYQVLQEGSHRKYKDPAHRSLKHFPCLQQHCFLNGSRHNSTTLRQHILSPWAYTGQKLTSHSIMTEKEKVLSKNFWLTTQAARGFSDRFFISITNTHSANLNIWYWHFQLSNQLK